MTRGCVSKGNIYDIGHFSQAAVSVKISNLLIYFCSFGLPCPILEKENVNRKFVYCICHGR